jgi:predicted permease
MFQNYLTTAIRGIIRQKGYTFINISGLSVGLAAFILISLWFYHELSFNRYNRNFDNIYRFAQTQQYTTGPLTTPCMPAPLAADAKRDFAEFEEVFRFYEQSAVVSFGDKKFIESITPADSGLFKVFDFKLVSGTLDGALKEPFTTVITDKAAEKFFGKTDVTGQFLRFNDKQDFRITAVIERPPTNSSFQDDFYIPFDYLIEMGFTLKEYDWNTFFIYAQLSPGVDYSDFNKKFANYFQQVQKDTTITTTLFLSPLSKENLYYYDGTPTKIRSIYTFGIIAIFTLLIACINFMNLSTARAAKRSREIGLRKVVGATRKQLIYQFIGESLLMSFISLIFAMLLVQLFLPLFNELSGKELSFSLVDPFIVISLILVTLFTGIIAGSYPALYLSSFRPVKVMKSHGNNPKGNTWFRRSLVVFQFVLSVGLIISTIVMYRQLNFMLHSDLGMNKENVIFFSFRGDLKDKYEAFKGQLKTNPDVLAVGCSSHLPFMVGSNSGGFSWENKNENDDVLINLEFADVDFPELMKINLVSGRYFSKDFSTDTSAILVNQKTAKLMGIEDPVGKWISWGDNYRFRIIGMVKDFHFQKMQSEIDPLIIFNAPASTQFVFVRINGENTEKSVNTIESSWNSFVPAFPFEYKFLDATYEKIYQNETRLSKIFGYFAILAVIISCLGLFGLASFMAEQRTKEIGIRNVLGSSIAQIIVLQQREFLWLVAIANIIAWPLAWYFMKTYLDSFAFKITLSPSIFIIAGFLSLMITFLTVFFLAYNAAIRDPVNAIKYE